jgi:hypothetical protein
MGSPYCANMLLLYKRRMDMISREPNKSERKLHKPNNPPKQAKIKKNGREDLNNRGGPRTKASGKHDSHHQQNMISTDEK